MAFYVSNLNNVNAVVADIGSYSTKIGFAGDDYPRAHFRSNVGVLREQGDDDTTSDKRQKRKNIIKVNYDTLHRPADGSDDGDWEVANPVDFTTGLWYENPTSSNGTSNNGDGDAAGVGGASFNSGDATATTTNNNNNSNGSTDWSELIPTFLDHAYTTSLGYESGIKSSEVPLLMMERSYNPPPIRQQLLEILFEECDVPATFLGRDATMACYACGRTTSTVVDVGYSGTTVSPVYEGYVEQKAIRRSPVGTKAMDELAFSQLEALVVAQQKAKIRNLKKKGSSNLQPQGIKLLYEVRHPNGNNASTTTTKQRHPAFRRLALLDIARDGRETGACQAINTSAIATIAAPNISYTLPDGTMVDVPSRDRFAVANLVVGRCGGGTAAAAAAAAAAAVADASGTAGDTEEETTRRLREEYLANNKRDYELLLKRAMGEKQDTAANNDKNGDEMDVDENDDAAADDVKRQASKYTEATAVGISSSRRGGRKITTTTTTTSTANSSPAAGSGGHRRVLFNNHVLQKACLPYLQTCFEDELTSSSVANMVCDAAFRCDRDQQAGVLGNVVLAGGGSCIGPTDQSVPDYLRDQMEAIIHVHTPGWKVRILSPGMQERAIASWLGGSILGSLGTFHDMWITKADYDEWGSAIVNRKCP